MNRLNNVKRWPTPEATVQAVLYCVRARGLPALDEPANIARLLTFDNSAHDRLNTTIESWIAKGIVKDTANG